MTKVDEKRLSSALEEGELDGEAEARARTLATIRAAYAERETRPPRRHRVAVGLAAVLLAATGVVGLSPAGAEFRDWVADTIDPESTQPKPALTHLPHGGSLLVQSRLGASVVSEDGSRRFLGDFSSASWSPHGLYVAGAEGRTLAAVDPAGALRWSISAERPVRLPAWSRDLGYRVAYLSGDELRVVAGDGTADRGLGSAGPVRPAWRPGSDRELAYVGGDGAIEVVDVDRSTRTSRLAAAPGVTGLAWSGDGSRLLSFSPAEIRVSDPDGGAASSYPAANGFTITEAAFLSGSQKLAIVQVREPEGATATSTVSLLEPGDGGFRRTTVFQTPGLLRGLAVAPDGEQLAVGWEDADQWLFLDPERGGSLTAVENVSAQVAPGSRGAPFPVPREWCCPGD